MIRHTEVDGVPTIVAPTAGPMRAGLTFRVGRADEILSRSGITHLLEHLALHRLGQVDYHFNGGTGPITTHFYTQGSESAIVEFFAGVCASLANLPFERLETEKAILRTEESGRGSSAAEPLAVWRYGARGYGLDGYPEWGLPMISPDDLRGWAAYYFTRGNAVLWIAGSDVPAGLRLTLPDGERRPVPAVTSALPRTPAWFPGPSTSVAYDAVVRRRPASSVFAAVLERELFRALRQEGGLSYTAASAHEPRGDGYAVIRALADALPEKQDAVLGGFVDVLAKLRVGRIEQTDLDWALHRSEETLANPEVHAGRLPSYAMNMLVGYPNKTVDELRAEVKAVTAADVHEAAVEAAASGLLMVPHGTSADWAGFVAAPDESTSAVSGTPFPHRSRSDAQLVVAHDGVSVVANGAVTVRYDECAVMLAWPDGGRMLVGHDAITVRVEPTMWRADPAALAAIDAAVPPYARVTMPPRDPSEIPSAAPSGGPSTPRAAPSGGARARMVVAIVLLAIALLLVGGLTFLLAVGLMIDPEGGGTLWPVVGGGVLLCAFLIWRLVKNARALRGR